MDSTKGFIKIREKSSFLVLLYLILENYILYCKINIKQIRKFKEYCLYIPAGFYGGHCICKEIAITSIEGCIQITS